MALKATPSTTINARTESQFGPRSVKTGTLAFDASYPTNGEALLLSQIGLSTIDQLIIPSFAGYTFVYDSANTKVKVYWVDTTTDGAPQAEVANTTDLSALTAVPYTAYGVEA